MMLTRRQAAAMLGTSVHALRRLALHGLHPVRQNDGTWLYRPADIAAHRARLEAQQ